METPSRSLLRLGVFGAALSTALLLTMAFVNLPGGLFYPGLPALTGSLPLSPAEQTAYLTGMRLLFALDGLFLAGWVLAWVGIGELVRARQPLLGRLTLLFGLSGALCDFSENSLIWGALLTEGLLLWLLQDIPVKKHKSAGFLLLVSSVGGFILSLLGMTSIGVLRANGWIPLAAFGVFALLYAYLLFLQPNSAPTE